MILFSFSIFSPTVNPFCSFYDEIRTSIPPSCKEETERVRRRAYQREFLFQRRTPGAPRLRKPLGLT